MAIDLNKVEREAPELLSLVKTSQINLDKRKLSNHRARVALMLDISGSMQGLYNSGKVHELVKRVLPLGLQFDDDGQIDVFAFGSNAQEIGEYGLSNYKECVPDILRKTRFSGTRYDKALELLLSRYKGSTMPVYVMFVTDGETENKSESERLVRELSKEQIFLQFIGLGEDITPDTQPKKAKGFFGRLTASFTTSFEFLSKLDDLSGRAVDNANFFAIMDPTSVSDERLYELLMNEYPQWLEAAKAKGIVR